MSGVNSVKNYKYSILVKKIGVLKRRKKKDEKKCASIGSSAYYLLRIMISHKRYFLATHHKLQAKISKSLTHRLIISYRVRDLTNHFFK